MFRQQIDTILHRGKPFGTPISQRCFFGTSRTFSSAAANSKAVGGWWFQCITLAYTLSQAPCGLFFPHCELYSGCNWADLWHYFFTTLFPYNSRSQIIAFCVCGQSTRTLPFLLATLVCSSVRCGCLTPSLITPKRTDVFCFSRVQKNVSNKKTLLFLAFAVCFSFFPKTIF